MNAVLSTQSRAGMPSGMLGITAAPLGQLAMALFDEIECGMVVCEASGRIQFANRTAQHELQAARLLVSDEGFLRRADGTSGELEAAVRLAAQRGKRSLVRLNGDGDRLLVSVLPLATDAGSAPQVLAMMGRRQPCSDLGLEMLASCYGLTLAERRVLSRLVREASPREIAVENNVALSTVRTQIMSIRTKLGTRSVEGLLLRAAEIPPLAGALRMTRGTEWHRDPARERVAA